MWSRLLKVRSEEARRRGLCECKMVAACQFRHLLRMAASHFLAAAFLVSRQRTQLTWLLSSYRPKRPRAGGIPRLQSRLPRDDPHQHRRERAGLCMLECESLLDCNATVLWGKKEMRCVVSFRTGSDRSKGPIVSICNCIFTGVWSASLGHQSFVSGLSSSWLGLGHQMRPV
jgi:hypothetical protein